jgi:hypothetical protein
MATDAANYLCHQLQHLLGPISSAMSQSGPWEERSVMVRLTQKLQKSKRNKWWRQRRRKHVAELFQKVPLVVVTFYTSHYTFLVPSFQTAKKTNHVNCEMWMASLVLLFHRSVRIMIELTRKLMNGGLSK